MVVDLGENCLARPAMDETAVRLVSGMGAEDSDGLSVAADVGAGLSEMMRRMEARISSIDGSWTLAAYVIWSNPGITRNANHRS